MSARGRQLFHNPGPTNIPDRVLCAMHHGSIDHRGDEFASVLHECSKGLRELFDLEGGKVITFSGSGHGAWESSLVNVCSAGDKVLSLQTGFFSNGWADYARRHGLDVEAIEHVPNSSVDAARVEARLRADVDHSIKAVLVTHSETSTGVLNDCSAVRDAIDAARHPCLLMVDAISSLGSLPVEATRWRADVVLAASQKGLMLPTGLCFVALSERALEASGDAGLSRAYWDWRPLLAGAEQVDFPGTAPVHMMLGLRESLRMLQEEGLQNVFARHVRLGSLARVAVRAWSEKTGIRLFPRSEKIASNSVTAIEMPSAIDADAVREIANKSFNVVVAGGIGELKGRILRIGHLGDLNEAMLLGAIAIVEVALKDVGVVFHRSGLEAAAAQLSGAGSWSQRPTKMVSS